AAPFLPASHGDARRALFTYDAVLIAGTMYLARRRAWPTLNVVSYTLTVFTVAAWAIEFYASSKYLTTEVFLTLFCAMYGYILHASRRAGRTTGFEQVILWSAPILYYLASLLV